MFRFIRTGWRPVEQTANASELTACFEPCTIEVQDRLQAFLVSGQEQVAFDFGDSQVIIKREVKNATKNKSAN